MQSHPDIWQETITISSFDVGDSGHMEAAALMRHFQESAARHATHLKVGFDDLRHENIFWALTHIQIEISRWPDMNETVWVETWPRGIEKLYTTRDFQVKDQSRHTIINATSAWIMVDIERKRPVRPSARLSNIPFVPEIKALGDFPDAIPEWNEGEEETEKKERKVVYSDLDINGHVNNTRYVEWVMDAIAPSKEDMLKSLHLQFMHEFLAGETAFLTMNSTPKRSFQISINHQDRKKTGCLAFLAFSQDH